MNHGIGEYVSGKAHEHCRGLLQLAQARRQRRYHQVSRGHLGRYVDEFSFRYENRKVSDAERAALLVNGADGKRLTYKQPA